jgi:anhydro-N-acetylmuramic acid kinase
VTDRLQELKALAERRVIGLNCGTSLDGIDAVLLRVEGSGFAVRFKVEDYVERPLPDAVRAALTHMHDLKASELCGLDFAVGDAFARAALDLIEGHALPKRQLLIGSHGITIFHRPPRRAGERGSTLQIGEPAVIAERTGAAVAADFRTGDVAAGGQGAPLMPYLDYVLFRESPGTVLVNLGGIANLTFVETELEGVRAFDSGPANLPLNHVMRRLSAGQSDMDAEGRTAATGHIDAILLEHLMALPYLHAPPPKTTGREDFGEAWTDRLLDTHEHLKLVDILATLTLFVARHLKLACDSWLPCDRVRQVIVSGGGAHNATLMHHLRRAFDPVPVSTFPETICKGDAKEAVLFALLANERLFGRPSNVPSATGARWPVSLGKMMW